MAQTLRIATLNTDLERDGPGLLLRDILKGEDAQLLALRKVVAEVDPDILVLQGIDYDHGLATLGALQAWLAEGGPSYPYVFARAPNTGVQTGLDLDGDGRSHTARDAQGYGEFFGQGGMAILSRHPLNDDAAQDFTSLLWRDLPGARLPMVDGMPFPSEQAQAVQHLPSVGHWVVPVLLNDAPVHLLVFHASPPVFDGAEDRNGLRNHDELVFWQRYLDGAFGPAPKGRFVLAGVGNVDPVDGEGIKRAITGLLADPRLQDPMPMRMGDASEEAHGHSGDPRLDTVAWPLPDPGHLRVSYILPSSDLTVTGAGVFWPDPADPMAQVVEQASRHRMVWVDLALE